jgi:hypothetical protein
MPYVLGLNRLLTRLYGPLRPCMPPATWEQLCQEWAPAIAQYRQQYRQARRARRR